MSTSGEKEGISSADIVAGFESFAATTGATLVINIPAGRIWIGTVTVNCNCTENAGSAVAALAQGIITTTGIGVIPTAGTYFEVTAATALDAATDLTGENSTASGAIQMIVAAGASNTGSIKAAANIAGSSGLVTVSAFGTLQ